MDLFGIVRVTVRVTWLRGREAAGEQAAPASGTASAPAPDEPAPAQPVGSGPVAQPVPPEPFVPPPVPVRPGAPAADEEADVRSLISLADDLAGLADRAAGESGGDRTLRLAQWRVDQVLAQRGVQAVCDEGPVDPGRHEVVGSRPASAGGPPGWIAATIRPGYVSGDRLIRPQQVVAYAAGADAGREESDDAGRG